VPETAGPAALGLKTGQYILSAVEADERCVGKQNHRAFDADFELFLNTKNIRPNSRRGFQ